MSTRSKTGSLPSSAPAPTITKPRPARARPSAKVSKSSSSKSVSPAASNSPLSKILPDLTLPCDDGQSRALHSLFTDDHPGLILFTYPRANTGGCTAQAKGLSAFAAEAATLGYSVAGASYDSVKSQASWKAKYDLKVRLFCDTVDLGLLKKLAAHKAPKGVKRSLFVIRRGGENGEDGDKPIVVVARVVISPKDSISVAQDYCRQHPCIPQEESADVQMKAGKKDDNNMEKEKEKDNQNEKDKSNHDEMNKDDNDDSNQRQADTDKKDVN